MGPTSIDFHLYPFYCDTGVSNNPHRCQEAPNTVATFLKESVILIFNFW